MLSERKSKWRRRLKFIEPHASRPRRPWLIFDEKTMNSRKPLLYTLVLALGILTPVSFSAEPTPQALAEKLPAQRIETKVLKVYSAVDGAAKFRAYVVMWNEQEVIASDPLAKSDYKEGDSIVVLAMNQPFPQGKEAYRLLAFVVMPEGR